MEMNTTKNKTVIAILFGGCSTEYEVSLQSAYSVITHLNQEKYEAHLIGITREGTWLCYEGDIDRIPADTWASALEKCQKKQWQKYLKMHWKKSRKKYLAPFL